MKVISKNYYKGEKIINPSDLVRLALEKRSVYHPNWGVKPASVIISMPLREVMKAIEANKLFYIHK